jgi:cold shock CspA family protein
MAKSKESFNKREKEKKKAQQKQQKAERLGERKSSAKKGKSLDEIDEDGNLSTTPPDPSKRREVNVEDIQIGVVRQEEEEEEGPRTGVVDYFNSSKGFGFIKDRQSGERIFVHINQLSEPISESDKVTFEIGSGPKVPMAINVKKA